MSTKSAKPHLDAVMAELAEAQHGVFARRQLLAREVDANEIKHRVRTGGLHRLHRGVYSLTPRHNLRIQGHWMAAVLACGPGAVLSHATAAALWDLRRSSASVIDVTVAVAGGRKKQRGIRLHRSVTLDDGQCDTHEGIPVTSVARTLIDLADTRDRRTAERATDEAEVLQLFDLKAIRAAIDANPGRRGAAVMRQIIEEYEIGVGLTESELEEMFLRLCDRFGIARPDAQGRVGPGRVDFVWRHQRLVVEVDSWRRHGARRQWESDRKRDIALQRSGYRVARISYLRMLREPEAVAEDLKTLLSAAPSAALRRAG